MLFGPPSNAQSPVTPGQAITPTSNTPFPINTANPLTNPVAPLPVQPTAPVPQTQIPAANVPTTQIAPQSPLPPAQTISPPNTAAVAPAPIPAPIQAPIQAPIPAPIPALTP